METKSFFEQAVATSGIWYPFVEWTLRRISATKSGREIGEAARSAIAFLKDPESERAFQEAFQEGLGRFQEENPDEIALAVAGVLERSVEEGELEIDQKQLLAYVLDSEATPRDFADLVKKYAFVYEDSWVTPERCAEALDSLFVEYLRPAFRRHEYFAERAGFSEVLKLLREIKEELQRPLPDLASQREDFLSRVEKTNEQITTKGISPKVQNRTIGIKMEDVFIPLRARNNDSYDWKEVFSGTYESYEKLLNIDSSIGAENDWKDIFEEHLGELDQKTETHLEDLFARSSESFEGWKEISTELLSGEPRAIDEGETVEIKDLLSHPRTVVQGDPGSGKSTLTRFVSWAVASGKSEYLGGAYTDVLPVRVRAIEFGEALQGQAVSDLYEYIIREAGRFDQLVKQEIMLGKALILVDGLDEVGQPALRERVKKCLSRFVADPAFSDNQFLVTTRIVGYQRSGLIGAFSHFTLAELNDDQIRGFVEGWYKVIQSETSDNLNVERERDQLLEAALKNRSIHRLARNPLLLTIIALIKWQGRALPEQRVMLYDVAMQTLIKSWPLTQRQVELDELFIREWLAPVARTVFESSKDLIDEYSLMEELVASMKKLKPIPEIEAKERSRELLDNVSVHSGVILPKGEDRDGRTLYGFLHQTFSEYLTAFHLMGQWEDDELDLSEIAHDPYWHEVLLLMAGQLGAQRRRRAGKFIEAIMGLESRYEDLLHRDLLLAAAILGDGVLVGPADLVRSILQDILSLWNSTSINSLRDDLRDIISKVGDTEHGRALEVLLWEMELEQLKRLELAGVLEADIPEERLQEMLESENRQVRLRTVAHSVRHMEQLSDEAVRVLKQLGEGEFDFSIAMATLPSLRESNSGLFESTAERLIDSASPEKWGWQLLLSWLANLGNEKALREIEDSLGDMKGGFSPQAHYALIKHTDYELTDILDHIVENIPLPVLKDFLEYVEDEGDYATDELLGTDNPKLHLAAASTLAEGRKESELKKLLEVEDKEVRLWAASELEISEKVLNTLIDLLEAEDNSIRLRAALRIAEGNYSERVEEVLLDTIDSGNLYLQCQTADLLFERGDENTIDAARRKLKELSKSEDRYIEQEATLSLARNGDNDAIQKAIEIFTRGDTWLNDKVREFFEDADSRIVNKLVQTLDEGGGGEKRRIASILVELKSEKAHRAIEDRLEEFTLRSETGKFQNPGLADVAYRYLREKLDFSSSPVKHSRL
jgi:HEAT repeat protein/DNA-binding Lrp family transcriptional regulator